MTEGRPITGRTALLIFVGMFGTIIAVNVFMAFMAVSTFPGLENEKRFSRSQKFEELRQAQDALGWTVAARVESGQLLLSITDASGAVVRPAQLTGLYGLATSTRDDQQLQWVETATGYAAPIRTERGNWNLRLNALSADGTRFQQRLVIGDGRG